MACSTHNSFCCSLMRLYRATLNTALMLGIHAAQSFILGITSNHHPSSRSQQSRKSRSRPLFPPSPPFLPPSLYSRWFLSTAVDFLFTTRTKLFLSWRFFADWSNFFFIYLLSSSVALFFSAGWERLAFSRESPTPYDLYAYGRLTEYTCSQYCTYLLTQGGRVNYAFCWTVFA